MPQGPLNSKNLKIIIMYESLESRTAMDDLQQFTDIPIFRSIRLRFFLRARIYLQKTGYQLWLHFRIVALRLEFL